MKTFFYKNLTFDKFLKTIFKSLKKFIFEQLLGAWYIYIYIYIYTHTCCRKIKGKKENRILGKKTEWIFFRSFTYFIGSHKAMYIITNDHPLVFTMLQILIFIILSFGWS